MLVFSTKKSRRDVLVEEILHNIFRKISKPSTRLCAQTYTFNAKIFYSLHFLFFLSTFPSDKLRIFQRMALSSYKTSIHTKSMHHITQFRALTTVYNFAFSPSLVWRTTLKLFSSNSRRMSGAH